MKKMIPVIALLITLSACAEEQRPASQQLPQGYDAHQTQENVWEVKVNGTGHPADKVQRMALWRAAKLTLEQNRDRFQIIGGSGVQNTGMTQTGGTAQQPIYMNNASGDILIKIYRNNEVGMIPTYDARQAIQLYGAEFANMN